MNARHTIGICFDERRNVTRFRRTIGFLPDRRVPEIRIISHRGLRTRGFMFNFCRMPVNRDTIVSVGSVRVLNFQRFQNVNAKSHDEPILLTGID